MTDLLSELEAVVGIDRDKRILSSEGEGRSADALLRRFQSAAADFFRARRAEIAAAVRDAERYRWLRDDAPDEWEINRWVGQTMQEVLIDPSELDAAIDAAMSQEGEG